MKKIWEKLYFSLKKIFSILPVKLCIPAPTVAKKQPIKMTIECETAPAISAITSFPYALSPNLKKNENLKNFIKFFLLVANVKRIDGGTE